MFNAVNGRIVVKPNVAEDEILASGFIVPKEVAQKDTVASSGTVVVGISTPELTLTVGQTVYFSKFGFDQVKDEKGDLYYFVSAALVLGWV